MKDKTNPAARTLALILKTTLTLIGIFFTSLDSNDLIRAAPSVTGNWTRTGSLDMARYDHTATLLPNGNVLVVGGAGPGSCFTPISNAELYDPVTGTWSHAGSLNTARAKHTATLLQNGQVLVAGGYAPQVSLNSAELYDPVTRMWRPTGSFNTIWEHSSATLLPNGKVLAVGNSSAQLTSAELYDPATGTWSGTGAPGSFPSKTVLLANGKVLAVSEGSPWELLSTGAELYEPATGQWSTAGFLNMFWTPTVTLLRNGKVLATGLYGPNNLTQANIYDTNTGMWSITGNLSTFRNYGGYTATLLANGQVLLAGGANSISTEPVNAEELYDPTTGTWRQTSRLITGRNGHTATLLRDGKVLIAGGAELSGFCGSPLASAELYEAETSSTSNPIDDPEFFVRQHYLDFLNREPDPEGLAFWINELAFCGVDQACIEHKRINISAAFFLSIEFQQTGYLVYRLYQSAYGRRIFGFVPLTLQEFLPDLQKIGQGVVVQAPGWEQLLEANKQAFAVEFVSRPSFLAEYPPELGAAEFVDRLNSNANGTLTKSLRDELVAQLANGALTRAEVLRSVAENGDPFVACIYACCGCWDYANSEESVNTSADESFYTSELNRAFVLMQYFGYLRRNPNAPPDADFAGYQFWLTKLEQFNGNFVDAEMVKAFLVSEEYRRRFGTP